MAVLWDKELEDLLYQKVSDALKKKRGLREPKIEDVFKVKRYYLGPDDFLIVNYYKKKPISAFNPGALLKGDEVLIFPRLIFDFYVYASSVGVTKVKVNELIQGDFERPLRTKLILWPTFVWEQRGTEDPRAFDYNGKVALLYTPKGVYMDKDGSKIVTDTLALAIYNDEFKLIRKGFFFVVKDDKRAIFSNRDSAVLKLKNDKASILTRPVVKRMKLCWKAVADLEKLEMYADTMDVVFPPEDFESHVGWSTNTVRLSSGEYLVGWHGVREDDQVYRDGIAVVDEEGNLLGITNYILSPEENNPFEEYGDRPGTMFGNGLILYKDLLIWIGGVGDSGIGIFIAELDKVLEKVKWLE